MLLKIDKTQQVISFNFFGCTAQHARSWFPIPIAVEEQNLNHWTAGEVPASLLFLSSQNTSPSTSLSTLFSLTFIAAFSPQP